MNTTLIWKTFLGKIIHMYTGTIRKKVLFQINVYNYMWLFFLSGQHKLNTKKNIIEVAKEFPTYFARLYPVTSGQNTEDMQYLAISHSGIRLVRREKSLPTDYLQVSVPLYNYFLHWNFTYFSSWINQLKN